MDRMVAFCALSGFSFTAFLCSQACKKWQRQMAMMETWKTISEALEHAEERALRYQERHDRILKEITSRYLGTSDLEEVLAGARADMKEALEFAASFRTMQIKLLSSFIGENVSSYVDLQDRSHGRSR